MLGFDTPGHRSADDPVRRRQNMTGSACVRPDGMRSCVPQVLLWTLDMSRWSSTTGTSARGHRPLGTRPEEIDRTGTQIEAAATPGPQLGFRRCSRPRTRRPSRRWPAVVASCQQRPKINPLATLEPKCRTGVSFHVPLTIEAVIFTPEPQPRCQACCGCNAARAASHLRTFASPSMMSGPCPFRCRLADNAVTSHQAK